MNQVHDKLKDSSKNRASIFSQIYFVLLAVRPAHRSTCRIPSSSLPATRSIIIHLRLVALNLAHDRLFQQTLVNSKIYQFEDLKIESTLKCIIL